MVRTKSNPKKWNVGVRRGYKTALASKAARVASVATARALSSMGAGRSLGGRASVDRTTNVFRNLNKVVYQVGGLWQNAQGAITFKLSDMHNFKAYTEIYDAYRIKRAIVRFQNATTGCNYTQVQQYGTPTIMFCKDYDDNTLQTDFTDVIQANGSTKQIHLTGEYCESLVPKCAIRTYNDANLTQVGYAEGKAGQWLDTDYPDVPHYGMKYWVPTQVGDPTTGVAMSPFAQVHIWVELEIEFKNAKL